MTNEEYILECDVILCKAYYKSEVPWLIIAKPSINLTSGLNRIQFSWQDTRDPGHTLHLYSYETKEDLPEEWKEERYATVTEAMSFMKESEDYKFAIQCILSCPEFIEELEPIYLEKLNDLV